jgi:hypothetical protein
MVAKAEKLAKADTSRSVVGTLLVARVASLRLTLEAQAFPMVETSLLVLVAQVVGITLAVEISNSTVDTPTLMVLVETST